MLGLSAAQVAARTGDLPDFDDALTGTATPWVSAAPVLAPADNDRYRDIFALQADGKFREADQRIEQLGNRVLLGHVLAQRYMHAKYTTSYGELAQWLEDNGDHVGAEKIYRLALSKLPQGRAAPNPPPGPTLPSALRGGEQPPVADVAGKVATSDFEDAVAAWRAGKISVALKAFERVAGLNGAPVEDKAAAAFWAARANLRLGHAAKVNQWLVRAAEFPHTFYGLVALRQLGQEIDMRSDPNGDRYSVFERVLGVPAVRRALALSEIGERDRALGEMRALYRQANDESGPLLLEIAARVDAPAEVMKLGYEATARMDRTKATAALYPVPRWEPIGGFIVDRALLFALMRRESGFEAGARSAASARGLMQLMPQTAAFVAKEPSLGLPVKGKLDDPRVNLELGQRYILHLVRTEPVKGSLIHLLAAYNAGPSNLKVWREKLKIEDDPLLFVASLPYRETRGFVEHVLAAYWIYASRMGRDLRSLDELAGGKWPLYVDEGTARERSQDYAAD